MTHRFCMMMGRCGTELQQAALVKPAEREKSAPGKSLKLDLEIAKQERDTALDQASCFQVRCQTSSHENKNKQAVRK